MRAHDPVDDMRNLTVSRILPGLLLTTCILVTMTATAPTLQARDLESAVAGVPNPRVTYGGWVSDPGGAISARRDEINRTIDALEQQTGVEIAVVVLPSIGEFVPKQFATELFNQWSVGKQDLDNGILVLQILDQRRVEIETGYGLEGALPDVKCRWIVDDIAIPFFKSGSFSDGHYEMVRALERGVRNSEIGRDELVSGVTIEPGVSVDPEPTPYELPEVEASITDYNESATTTILAIFALPAGLIILLMWTIFYWRFRTAKPEPYAEYQFYKTGSYAATLGTSLMTSSPGLWEVQSLESGWSFLAVIPGLFVTGRQRVKHLKHLRDKPRVDPETGATMQRLSETEDDAFLEPGNVSEEELGSLDYDVWVSPSGLHKIERYDGHVSASNCEDCGYKTYRQTSSRTIRSATTSSSGLAEDTYNCAHCGKTRIVQRTIPKISTSSGSGSSSGGGSFGGGSSGGGGAGGSY